MTTHTKTINISLEQQNEETLSLLSLARLTQKWGFSKKFTATAFLVKHYESLELN